MTVCTFITLTTCKKRDTEYQELIILWKLILIQIFQNILGNFHRLIVDEVHTDLCLCLTKGNLETFL